MAMMMTRMPTTMEMMMMVTKIQIATMEPTSTTSSSSPAIATACPWTATSQTKTMLPSDLL